MGNTRICFYTVPGITIEPKMIKSRKRLHASGIMADKVQLLIDMFGDALDNTTYHFVGSDAECVLRLEKNLSDGSNTMTTLGAKGLKVPVTSFSSHPSFITGYNVTEIRPSDCSSALATFGLLSGGVYLASLAILLSCVGVIAARLLVHRHHRGQACIVRKKERSFARSVARYLHLVVDGSSHRFRIISLVLTALVFYTSNSFRSVYKTSQVVVAEPAVVKTYRELAEHKTAEPIIYDGLAPLSHKFKNAPADSDKAAVWRKLLKVGMENIHDNFDDALAAVISLKKSAYDVVAKKSAFIINSLAVLGFSNLLCCLSPENEFWRFTPNSDPCEGEELAGFAVSPFFSGHSMHVLVVRQRRVTEQDVLGYVIRDFKQLSEMGPSVGGTTSRHIEKQLKICSDQFKFDFTHDELHPLDVTFYASLFILCLTMNTLACVSFACEICCPPSRGQRRPRRRPKVAPSLGNK